MDHFYYREDELFCENVMVKEVARQVGTPFYLYSRAAIEDKLRQVERAFSRLDHLICYALKANSNLEVLKILVAQGCGADVVSGGELFLALKAGFDPQRIIYAGVGKKDEEIKYAIEEGIWAFNVESEEEVRVINAIADRMGRTVKIGLRVNPNIDPGSHPYIATGLAENKFGIDIELVPQIFKLVLSLPALKIVGLHSHIGSQISQLKPLVENVKCLTHVATELKMMGADLEYLDMGGGLGVNYVGDSDSDGIPPSVDDLAEAIYSLLKDIGCKVIFEPGRVLLAEAGLLVTKVLYVKKSRKPKSSAVTAAPADRKFVVVDAAMNDLLRPALYGAYHQILPLRKKQEAEQIVDVVGPVCESSDFFAKDRPLPQVKRGDLLAILAVGAYGFSLSSNYNARPRVCEVLVEGKEFRTIRRRETYQDLM